MATNQATAEDVEKRSLRPLSDTEKAWASVRLEDAFRQIIVTVPSVAARLDADGVQITDAFPQLVIATQAGMLLRVLANPDGIRSEGSDDYTRTLDSAISTGALYLTDGERALLQAWDGASDGAFTITPWRAVTVPVPDPWSPVPATTTETFYGAQP